MNNRAVTLSLVMAVIAIVFVESYVSSIEETAKKKFGTEVLVVIASEDIKEMGTLDETKLELKRIPKRFLEPGAVSFQGDQDEGKKEMTKLVGSIAVVPIKKGEQISFNKLTEPSLRTGLSPQVTPGKRAYALPVNETSSVGKLIKPGDRVDVIGVLDGGGGKKISKILLQDVVVLAVGRNVTNNVARLLKKDGFNGKVRVQSLVTDDGFNSVTIEVEPHEVQMLAIVMDSGRSNVSLSLRNNHDTDRVNLRGMVLKDVLGPDAARVRQPARQSGVRRRGAR